MRKNVAGQVVGAQMVNASDGSEFTGSVTAYVLGDGGSQAVGSVGSGACTHEGHGFHTYTPAQAETNFDHIAFTFIGTGAVPASVQIYPNYPQTGDNFVRLGAPAGASHAADVAAVKADTAAVKLQTDKLTFSVANQIDANVLDWKGAAAPAMTGDAFARLGAPAGASVSADVAAVKSDSAAVKVQTDKLTFTIANQIDSNVIDWKGATAPAMTGDAFARLGAPAGASVSADVAAVKADSAAVKVQTDKLTFTVASQIDANVLDWKSSTAPAMTGDSFARLGAPAGASVSADVAAVKAVLPTALVSGRIDASVGAMAANVMTAAAAASDLTTELQAGLSTLDAAGVRTAVGLSSANLDTQLGAIGSKTTNLPADPADASDIATAFSTVSSALATIAGYIDTEVSAIKAYADRTVVRGTVSGTGPTSASFTTSALSPMGVDADQFKGRIIVFDNDTTTTALRGQATDITASSADSNPLLTFSALTTAPQAGDTFSIL